MDEEVVFYNPMQEQLIEEANKRVDARDHELDTTNIPVELDVEDMSTMDNEAFALVRRNGFGGSDSSVLLGVNPYTHISELIRQKSSYILTEEEKAVGEQAAVRKGNDLEPLIIDKTQYYLFPPKADGTEPDAVILKPGPMYKFTEFPYLKMNFDGVVVPKNGPMYPCEIKVCTTFGAKHYNFHKAYFREQIGYQAVPANVANEDMTIERKATHYGIPPYYYTQLQQEMMALDAEFGLLSVLDERTWCINVFFVYRDKLVQSQLVQAGYTTWAKVEAIRAKTDFDWSIEGILAYTANNKESGELENESE